MSIRRGSPMVVLAALTAAALLPTPAPGRAAEANQESIFEAFYDTGLDTQTAYAVRDLAIRRENMTLRLESGTVFLLQPIEGEVTGAVFLGKGVARMTPPDRTQRYMLKRRYGADRLDEPFGTAVFRFCDDFEDVIRENGRPGRGGAGLAQRAGEALAGRSEWMHNLRGFAIEARFLEIRLSNLQGVDFFIAELDTADHGWLTYMHDPQSYYENGLLAPATYGSKTQRYFEPWSLWHSPSDYGPKGHYLRNPARDGPQLFRVKHQEMELDLKNTRTVNWKARMLIEPQVDGLRALLFDLVNNARAASAWDDDSYNPVRLRAVTDAAGQPVPFIHKKDALLVTLPRPARNATPLTLEFEGTADVVEQLTAESFGLSQASWYPHYGFLGGRSSFHWTVRVPKPFLVSGSGRFVREFEDPETGQNGIEISEDAPIHFPWMIFGRFQMAEDRYVPEHSDRSLRMTIHSFPNMTVPINDSEILERIGAPHPFILELRAPSRKVDAFFEEGKQVLKLFESIYGPYPYDEIHIAQMAPFLGFGQAPQGFVQLTGEAFMSQAQLESDFFHGFYAHEIAHQWWAHQVGWASPGDEWLSESFAEYASGIFVHEFQGPKRFQRKLEEWRSGAVSSDHAAPIAAANLLRVPGAYRHRNNLLYNKGPYVLHMLRVQLDDAKYAEVMRSIQERYRNDNISTELLLREVNRVTGADYTYFFDQWFWDVGIPKFRYSWRARKQPGNKYLVTVNIAQEDEEHLKRVLMPIHFHFKGREPIPQYRPVVDAEQEIRFLLDEKPRDVTLDDERTLLAEFVKAR